ncbi:MAG: hypothetical protein PARBA_00765 [Parabacteroides sp.]
MSERNENNLPEGWSKIYLGEIITLEYGKSLIALERKKESIKFGGPTASLVLTTIS